ncbi:MAG: hypothetical protein AAB434_00040 [Planctomycetota bacterium]
MRTTLALVLALTAPLAADTGGGRVTWETDWTAAHTRAAREGLPILLYFTIPT